MEAEVQYAQLDSMCLKSGVHFATIGKIVEMDEEAILGLNPIYKRNYIPKGVTTPYCVTLPLDKIGILVSREEELYQLEQSTYINPVATQVTNVPDPEVPEDTTATVNTNNPPVNTTTTDAAYHKVQAGETLGTIATRYSMTVAELQRLNGLSSTKIYVGQRLKVKAGTSTTVVNNTTTPPPVTKQYYTVRAGDTFGNIAQRHRMSISQLRKLNPGINIERLSIGQKIRIK
jgi:LysM repeat protein